MLRIVLKEQKNKNKYDKKSSRQILELGQKEMPFEHKLECIQFLTAKIFQLINANEESVCKSEDNLKF